MAVRERALLLGAALVLSCAGGCGGAVESTQETAGTAGSGATGTGATATGAAGGTGGVGGTGGTGGASPDTCSDELKANAYEEPPPLGLKYIPAQPETGTLASVGAQSADILIGPDGGNTFTWRGPPLDDYFQPNTVVTAGSSQGWQYMANGTTIAATYTTYEFVPPDALPAVPMSKAPPLGFASQCHFLEGGGACGQPPAEVHVLAVTVGTAPDSIEVLVGETGTLGAFTVHNAQSSALPGYGSDDCILEALFFTGVTAIGPIGK